MSEYLGFAPTNEEEYFFVSYNSEDAGRLSKLLTDLSKEIPLWYDYGIPYGSKWEAQINKRISGSGCRGILFFITRGIFQKKNSYVFREYRIAQTFAEVPRYYIILDDIDPKADIIYRYQSWWTEIQDEQGIQSIRFTPKQLRGEILRMVKDTQAPSVSDYRSKQKRSNLVLYAFLIGSIVFAALGFFIYSLLHPGWLAALKTADSAGTVSTSERIRGRDYNGYMTPEYLDSLGNWLPDGIYRIAYDSEEALAVSEEGEVILTNEDASDSRQKFYISYAGNSLYRIESADQRGMFLTIGCDSDDSLYENCPIELRSYTEDKRQLFYLTDGPGIGINSAVDVLYSVVPNAAQTGLLITSGIPIGYHFYFQEITDTLHDAVEKQGLEATYLSECICTVTTADGTGAWQFDPDKGVFLGTPDGSDAQRFYLYRFSGCSYVLRPFQYPSYRLIHGPLEQEGEDAHAYGIYYSDAAWEQEMPLPILRTGKDEETFRIYYAYADQLGVESLSFDYISPLCVEADGLHETEEGSEPQQLWKIEQVSSATDVLSCISMDPDGLIRVDGELRGMTREELKSKTGSETDSAGFERIPVVVKDGKIRYDYERDLLPYQNEFVYFRFDDNDMLDVAGLYMVCDESRMEELCRKYEKLYGKGAYTDNGMFYILLRFNEFLSYDQRYLEVSMDENSEYYAYVRFVFV